MCGPSCHSGNGFRYCHMSKTILQNHLIKELFEWYCIVSSAQCLVSITMRGYYEGVRIAYLIHIGHGYASDMAGIRIHAVPEKRDTY